MATVDTRNETEVDITADQHDKSLDSLFLLYEAKVATLALDLTGSEEAAQKVVSAVFLRLGQELKLFPDEPIEVLVHRFTYDAALPLLLEKASQPDDSVMTIHQISSELPKITLT